MPVRHLLLFALVSLASAAPAMGQGFGRRGGGPAGGQGRGPGRDARHAEDRDVFHFLLANHDVIDRKVTETPDGVVTVTESTDPAVTEKLQEHVRWMHHRIKENKPIRRRDPLFDELFAHADKIKMEIEETAGGVRVTETSDEPYVVKLIQAHAQAVSQFVERGFAEARKNHPIPSRDTRAPANKQGSDFEFIHPKIKDHGQVVPLPDAAQQPASGSKICVDLTRASSPDELNPAIEKLTRYVNIYAGAGHQPADVQLSVVLHGDATLAVLKDDAYRQRFGTDNNPNLDCLHTLHDAGVSIYVCGQSLIGKGAEPDEVVVFADVAVSALTTLANLQRDGHAYVPLLK